jgi:hypothetical protein
VLCPFRRPKTPLDCALLNNNIALVAKSGPEIKSREFVLHTFKGKNPEGLRKTKAVSIFTFMALIHARYFLNKKLKKLYGLSQCGLLQCDKTSSLYCSVSPSPNINTDDVIICYVVGAIAC